MRNQIERSKEDASKLLDKEFSSKTLIN